MRNDSATTEAVCDKALSESTLAMGAFCRRGAGSWGALSPPARSLCASQTARAPLDQGLACRDKRLLVTGSPSCTCDMALVPGTMLMDWREFRGEPGT